MRRQNSSVSDVFSDYLTGCAPPQSDVELMTEKKILGFKPAPRLEQVDDEHSECVQDCKHRHQ